MGQAVSNGDAPRPALRVTDLDPYESAMLEMLAELVGQDTPAENKSVIDRMLVGLERQFASSGARTATLRRPTTGNLLRAEWGPESGKSVLLLAHVDTVWPDGEVARRPFHVEQGRAFGPGVLDMKAGVVVLNYAMKALAAAGLTDGQRVVALINADEEVGSADSRDEIEHEALNSHAALVLEPAMPDGALKTSRKGWGLVRLEISGRAAHAGANPEQGVSAVEELAKQVLYLHRLSNLERGTTVNVGVVTAGTRPNVIAAEALGEVDIRTTSADEALRVGDAIEHLQPDHAEARVRTTVVASRPPMERLPGNVALYNRTRLLANSMGFDIGEASSGAASDGNFATALGIPTLDGLGAVGAGPHAIDEMIEVASLRERAALLGSLIVSLRDLDRGLDL